MNNTIDNEQDATRLAIRRLELENENLRLRIELHKLVNNVPMTNNDTNTLLSTADQVSEQSSALASNKPTIDREQLAIEWVKSNPPQSGTRTDYYYDRYTHNVEYEVSYRKLVFIVKKTLGMTLDREYKTMKWCWST